CQAVVELRHAFLSDDAAEFKERSGVLGYRQGKDRLTMLAEFATLGHVAESEEVHVRARGERRLQVRLSMHLCYGVRVCWHVRIRGLHMVVRPAKALLTFLLGLFALLVGFDNIIDYGTNFAFVKHVLSMDTTPTGNKLMWRAITSEWVHHLAY